MAMKSLYVVLFIASIAANIPHASGQVGTQINIDKLLGHEEGLNNQWGEHLPRSSELDVSEWKADVKECRRKFYRFSRRLSEHNLNIEEGFKAYLECRIEADRAQKTLVIAALEDLRSFEAQT